MIAKARILIVEKQGIIAKDLEKVLEKFGYAVSAMAFSGRDAVREAKKDRPDLVLSEISLKGGMDGIEAASRIHSRFNIPVIFLTAVSDRKTIERAKKVEPYGYIIKPFEEETLHASIEMALHKHRSQTYKDEHVVSKTAVKREHNGGAGAEAGEEKEVWKRATFIVKTEHLEKIKAISYWDRKKVKDVLDEALELYLKGRHVAAVEKTGKKR